MFSGLVYVVGMPNHPQRTVTLLPHQRIFNNNGTTYSVWACKATRALPVWLVNGTCFDDLPTPSEEVTDILRHVESSVPGGVVSELTIPHIPYYNNSIIKCCIGPRIQCQHQPNNCSDERTFLPSEFLKSLYCCMTYYYFSWILCHVNNVCMHGIILYLHGRGKRAPLIDKHNENCMYYNWHKIYLCN